jgi:hypothetical protein
MTRVSALLFVMLATQPASAGLRCVETESAIEVHRGTRLVLRYNKVPTAEAAKNDPVYTRTGYIHPLCSPAGEIVTGDYAPDHPHQHGLFFAWTKTTFEGRNPEFWNQKLKSGRVSYVKTLAVVSGSEEAGFDVEHSFEDLIPEPGPVPALREIWRVRVKVIDGLYHVNLKSSQQCTTGPLTIEQYHYGGMAIRGNEQWLGPDKGYIVTSEGHDRVAGNHTRPEWVAMGGKIDGVSSGIAAFCHPDNFRFPQWVRLHPSKPYFVFSPMVEAPFVIKQGETYESRYRFVVFDGPLPERAIKQLAQQYRANFEK